MDSKMKINLVKVVIGLSVIGILIELGLNYYHNEPLFDNDFLGSLIVGVVAILICLGLLWKLKKSK